MLASATRTPFGVFRGRFEAYCDRTGVEFRESLVTPDSLAEYGVTHLVDHGNPYVLGFQWVDPIVAAIDYEQLSVASAQAFRVEYEAGLLEVA